MFSPTHEYPVIQKNKTKFKDITSVPNDEILLPEAKELFDNLLNSAKIRMHFFNDYKDNLQYIKNIDDDILYSNNVDDAIEFKTLTEIANKLVKFEMKYNIYKFKCIKNNNNKFIVYFFKNKNNI